MKWYLIENVSGDQFETDLKANSKDEACESAKAIWNALTAHDRSKRSEAYICYADLDRLDEAEEVTPIDTIPDKSEYVFNSYNEMINYAQAVELMDDEIREDLHRQMAPCSNQTFFDAYCEAHEQKYGEEFRV